MGGLFLLFTLVPVLELFLLVRVGAVIGPLNTLALVLVTGFVGAWLARSEGLRVLREWQQALERGEMPAEGVLSGLLVLVGGVLLITPGILTDVVGLWLLLPPTRRAAARLLRHYVHRQVQRGRVEVHTYGTSRGPFGGGSRPVGKPFERGAHGGPRRGPVRNGDVIDTSGEEVG